MPVAARSRSLGLGVLASLDPRCWLLGAAALVPASLYPLAKRVTRYPQARPLLPADSHAAARRGPAHRGAQAVLGATFNWGALLGWAAATGGLSATDYAPLLLYAAGWCWTMLYDTIYAHQDASDDAKVGIGSTALTFGAQSTWRYLAGFGAAQTTLLTAAGFAAGAHWPYFLAVGLGAGHLAWQVGTLDVSSPPDCLRKFLSNRDYGALIAAGCIASALPMVA